MWHLVQGNVLEFPRMFKNFHVWLQITSNNQMLGESRFPFKPILVEMWIFFKIGGIHILKFKENCIFYKLTILTPFFLSFKQSR